MVFSFRSIGLHKNYSIQYGFLTEQDTDIERQMTAADDNLLRAVVRNERHVLRHFVPL